MLVINPATNFNLIKLRPNYDGNYNLPPAPQEKNEPTYINDVQAAADGLIQTPIE